MNEPSVRAFFFSLIKNLAASLRQNKIAACLSLVALIVTTVLAINSEYDERDRYRKVILPDIQRAEAQFALAMMNADKAVTEAWKIHYFLSAHARARDVLRIAKSRWPSTARGIQAHRELIRYYELVTEELAIIRTEMSIKESIDFFGEWKEEEAKIHPIHERWSAWIRAPESERVMNPFLNIGPEYAMSVKTPLPAWTGGVAAAK